MRIALATCAEVPELDADGPGLIEALARRGVEAVPAVWDDPGVAWESFDLVVCCSTWDYAERRDVFLGWAEALPRVLNAPGILRWNTDKRYLLELAAAGVPVVSTRLLEPGDPFRAPAEPFVVKPAVSAGSRNAAWYRAGEEDRALAHVRALHAAGRAVLVQPYVGGIDVRGETGLVYLGHAFSHAFGKAALLQPGRGPGTALFLEETIERRAAKPEERALAEGALEAMPFPRSDLLYARVDLVPGPDDRPLLLELELTEPSLYLACGEGAADRFAAEIARRLTV